MSEMLVSLETFDALLNGICIPISTDIAFAVGLFLLFRNKYERKSNKLKMKYVVFLATVFLLAFFTVIHPIMPLVIIGVGLIEELLIKLNRRKMILHT